jgi:hypothetical protein
MNLGVLIFFVLVVLLILSLAWVARPAKRTFHAANEVLEALAVERHYARLPQILQALREEDAEYLRRFGERELVDRVRAERTAIAFRYLDYLEEEFQVLLEASRMLSGMAPELSAVREFDRFKQSLRFTICCRYLRWRLRFGLQPWNVFGTISEMAGNVTLQLEAATGRIGQRTMMGCAAPSLPEEGRSKPN